MKRRLVINGNEIYEIDEMCERERYRQKQKKREQDEWKKRQKQNGKGCFE